MHDVVSIGECMVELARRPDGVFTMRVGGDTFNTAIYLARLGARVAYMTAIGDDPYSALIRDTAQTEAIDTATIITVPERMPGLYLIETKDGERSFWYWRDRSPARQLFELDQASSLPQEISKAAIVYISGITLSLYSAAGLDRLEQALINARQAGNRVAMDGNFRPVGWQHDIPRAREIYARFWRHTDMALPSYDDEQALWRDREPAETCARLRSFGVTDICLKRAAAGAIVATANGLEAIPAETGITAIDTTAAGDSFSAAYLRARQLGRPPIEAAAFGNRLAAIVVQHPGAIAPASAMAGIVL